jgi:thioesterase domain-containing protein
MSVFFHRPRPWDGRALLILSHLNQDDPSLWPRILTGDLEVRTVDCDHHSIVREPHIGPVVDMVTAALRKLSLDASAG